MALEYVRTVFSQKSETYRKMSMEIFPFNHDNLVNCIRWQKNIPVLSRQSVKIAAKLWEEFEMFFIIKNLLSPNTLYYFLVKISQFSGKSVCAQPLYSVLCDKALLQQVG
jgi:hypothetical protein